MIDKYLDKIIHADCLDILKELPDNSIDLILTDPPYGIGIKKSVGRGRLAKVRIYENDGEWDKKIPDKKYFDELFRISKNQIIFGGNYFIEYLTNSSCWLVWDKLNGANYFADCELCWTSFKTAIRKYAYRWRGMLQHDMKNKQIRIHPTEKPIKLLEMMLNDYSESNSIILDPFSGSGTTAIAAIRTGRRFICIEKDKVYYEKSLERLKFERAQLNNRFYIPEKENLLFSNLTTGDI